VTDKRAVHFHPAIALSAGNMRGNDVREPYPVDHPQHVAVDRLGMGAVHPCWMGKASVALAPKAQGGSLAFGSGTH